MVNMVIVCGIGLQCGPELAGATDFFGCTGSGVAAGACDR